MNRPVRSLAILLFWLLSLAAYPLQAQTTDREAPNPTILRFLKTDLDELRSEVYEQEKRVTTNRRNARELDALIEETRDQLSRQQAQLDSALTILNRNGPGRTKRARPTIQPPQYAESPAPTQHSWLLLATILGFLSLIGYQARETGQLRTQHGESVGIKQLAVWLATGLFFYLVGFNLLFGPGGFIGWSNTLLLPAPADLRAAFEVGLTALPDGWPAPDYPGSGFLLLHFALAATVMSILSGALAERTRFFVFLLYGVLGMLLIYAPIGHWIWGNEFLPRNPAWLADLGFYDLAGSTAVHSVAGWMALAGILAVGARRGRFDPDGESQFRPAALSYSTLGVFLIWIGTLFINLAAWGQLDTELAILPVHLCLAAIGGGTIAFAHAFWRHRSQTYRYCLGGTLAGVVAASAGAHLYTPGSILVLGMVAGLLHNIIAEWTLRRQWDDPVGVLAVHLGGGIWGSLGLALLGQVERFPRNVDILAFADSGTESDLLTGTTDLIVNRFQQLLAQGFGVLVVGIWAFGIAWLLLRGIRQLGSLRVPEAEEETGA